MFKRLLMRAVPLPRPTAYESYLFIGPHPDDIEVACAPSVAALTAMGKTVSFAIVTDGGAGSADPALSGSELIETRQAEARASAALLGVTDITFLPFHDGGFYGEDALVRALCEVILQKKPDVVLAPDPDVIGECHIDHILAGRAAKRCMCVTPFSALTDALGWNGTHTVQALMLYYTARPNAYIGVKGTYAKRMEALGCHESQFDEATLRQMELYFRLRSMRFGLRRLCGMADGYRALGTVHMHCFPEVSE